MRADKPTLLLILDGWGLAPEGEGNAIHAAHTPNLDRAQAEYPGAELVCSGEAVGLPEGQMGNSEVGHLNLGAGRVVYQHIVRISQAIRNDSFADNEVLNQAMDRALENGGSLHLLGLVSDGGVHSHLEHLEALLQLASRKGLGDVVVHAVLDGRDTSPFAGYGYLERLLASMDRIGVGRIATVSGRYYAMDRDKRWDRTQLAYEAIVHGRGETARQSLQIVAAAYERGVSDEFLPPTVIVDEGGSPVGSMRHGDAGFIFNFRADRVRQIAQALFDPDFGEFDRGEAPQLSFLASMTMYDASFPLLVAFPQQRMDNILGEVLSGYGMRQLRIAETEKYAHVTYFFNGGREEPYSGEERKLIPSPREVATYDQKPEMSVHQVTEELERLWKEGGYDVIVCNFANLDMVGHTGDFQATVQACRAVDECVGRVMDMVLAEGGRLFLTADHGNAETMLDHHGKVQTAHSSSEVAFVWVEEEPPSGLRRKGILGDVAPTLLASLGLTPPEEMTGQSMYESGDAHQ
ncbi:MAG: 2,3-bisphosphoglycerate-independent phosphoglycerate mutase [Desulfohalobiaceae bacterium]